MLFIDVQEGLFGVARDFNHVQMKQAFIAQAELAKIFELPTVITSSSETGKDVIERAGAWRSNLNKSDRLFSQVPMDP